MKKSMSTPTIKALSARYSSVLPYLKEKKSQRYSSLVFTLIAIIFFGLFAINPTLSTIANLQRQLEDNKEIKQKLQTKINNLTKLRTQYQQLQNDLPIINAALPKEPTATELAAQIQGLAASAQVDLLHLQIQQIELANKNPLASSQNQLGTNQYVAYNFSFDIDGQYDEIMRFVDIFSSFQRIASIESASLTAGDRTTNSFSLSVRAKTYYKQ